MDVWKNSCSRLSGIMLTRLARCGIICGGLSKVRRKFKKFCMVLSVGSAQLQITSYVRTLFLHGECI